MLVYFVSIPPNLKYIDDTDSPVIIGITNGVVIINKQSEAMCLFFLLDILVMGWVFDSVIDPPKTMLTQIHAEMDIS